MSEYQYYEFQAIDRRLVQSEMDALRSCSSRATITDTRFVNHYNFGSFKGNPSSWMEKYFDAFLYLANWGTHDFRFRLPRRILELDTAQLYCRGEAAVARNKNDFIILEFLSQSDDRGGWDDEDESGWLSSLIPLRADLAAGDHRVLYLGWLLCVQAGELEADAIEPPIPGGLGSLTAPLQAFADFLRIDDDLITVAATRSPEADELPSDEELEAWLGTLSDGEKNGWLHRFATGREPHLRAELLRRFLESRPVSPHTGEPPRTVGELLATAGQHTKERRRREAERAAAERARREREKAESRERYLEGLAQREAKAWEEVDTLIATKHPSRYDDAVKLLCDLRDLGFRKGRASEVEARLLRLREQHARKPSFVERLTKAGLGKLGA